MRSSVRGAMVTPSETGVRVAVPLIGAGVESSWLVPAAIFLILIVASWLGLRGIKSEHLETLRSAPLFSGHLASDRDVWRRKGLGLEQVPLELNVHGSGHTGFLVEQAKKCRRRELQ